MEQRSTMMKVLSPVENKNGKTFWIRIGSAFLNRDGSTNVYLNAYPTSGKLQIRELDERDRNTSPRHGDGDRQRGYRSRDRVDDMQSTTNSQDDLPF